MICQKSEIEKQQYTLAILNLLVSTLILLVAVAWMWMSRGPISTSVAERPALFSDSTQLGGAGLGQEELLLQAKLLVNSLKLDCAVVVMLTGEGMLASRSDCTRDPGKTRELSKDGKQPFTSPVAATLGLDTPEQVSENPGSFIAL